MKFLLLGANSEIANEFIKICSNNKDETFLVTRSAKLQKKYKNVLVVDDYLNEVKKITSFIEKEENIYVVFFNGALYENRPIRFPTKEEIELTKKVNFTVPYEIFKQLNIHVKNIEKFIFISSMAALRLRNKNYLYGKSKRALEKKVLNSKKENNVLFFRFGKVFTSMSLGHKTPPFSLSANKAANKIYKNLHKLDIVYPSIGLFVMSLLIKLIPNKIFKKLSI